jgi:hypothetical protein
MRLRKRFMVVGFIVGGIVFAAGLALAQQDDERSAPGPTEADSPAATVAPPGVDPTEESDAAPVPATDFELDVGHEVGGPPNRITDTPVSPTLLDYCRKVISGPDSPENFQCEVVVAKGQGDLPPGDYTDAQLKQAIGGLEHREHD